MNIQERAIAQAIEEQAALIEKLQHKQKAFEAMREALKLVKANLLRYADGDSTLTDVFWSGTTEEQIDAALALADQLEEENKQ
jgi:chaperonin GroEL (HSP60 family)